MSEIATDLAAALRARRALIADENSRRDQASHLEKLQAASQKIDALSRRLPPPIDPQLAHFLARCSYDKALTFLEAEM